MVKIQKIISLEQFKSRLPGVIDSFSDSLTIDFNKENYEKQILPFTNYNLFPKDVYITTDIFGDDWSDLSIFKNKKEDEDGVTVSYPTLKGWWHFFIKYYNALSVNLKCGKRIYASVAEYNKFENEELDITWDDYYKSIGGDTLYQWMQENCFPMFNIPEELVDEWNAKQLSISEVIKWHGWFKERSIDYKDVDDISKCADTDDCCDCVKFMKLGGMDMYNMLKEFILNLNFNPNEKDDAYINIPIQFTTSIDDMGEFSIFSKDWENLTDYHSTLEAEFKEKDSGGTVVLYNDKSWIIKDGDDRLGYGFSEYKEGYFKEDDWNDYTQQMIGDRMVEFARFSADTYAYKDNKLVINPTAIQMADTNDIIYSANGFIYVDNSIYPVFKNDYIIYQRTDEQQPTFHTNKNYSLLNGEIVLVHYDDEKNKVNPYVIVNDKRYYALYDKDNGWVFKFTAKRKCNTSEGIVIEKDGSFVNYDNGIYQVDFRPEPNPTVTFKNFHEEGSYVTYDVFYGYTFYNDNIAMFNKNKELVYYVLGNEWENNKVHYKYVLTSDTVNFGESIDPQTASDDETTRGYWINWVDKKFYIYVPYYKYNTKYISGTTESKLSSLLTSSMACDDLGMELPGVLDKEALKNSLYIQPSAGDWLDLYYRVGNINPRLEPLPQFDKDNTNYYWGDILTTMEFYYIDSNGKKTVSALIDVHNMDNLANKSTIVIVDHVNGTTTKKEYINNLKAIEELQEYIKDENGIVKYEYSDMSADGLLRCDFTYYMGALLKRKYNKVNDYYYYDKYKLAAFEDGEKDYEKLKPTFGVEYKETALLHPSVCTYNLSKSSSYTINYYKLEFDTDIQYNQNYNNARYEVQMSTFKTTISSFETDGTSPYKDEDFMDDVSGFIDVPVLRLPYKFGSSSLQNLKTDIYIDRGINQAFDKHLKLLEVKTLEALEQYSNGFYNIIET